MSKEALILPPPPGSNVITKDLALRIKKERKIRGWRQEDLANEVGCKQQLIQKIEGATIQSSSHLAKVLHVLGLFQGYQPEPPVSKEPEVQRVHRARNGRREWQSIDYIPVYRLYYDEDGAMRIPEKPSGYKLRPAGPEYENEDLRLGEVPDNCMAPRWRQGQQLCLDASADRIARVRAGEGVVLQELEDGHKYHLREYVRTDEKTFHCIKYVAIKGGCKFIDDPMSRSKYRILFVVTGVTDP